jgi:hypothetical protein
MTEEVPAADKEFSARVEAALAKMAADKRMKKTKSQLAVLVGVSRGTLYNREWVTLRYDRFRVEVGEKKEKAQRRSDTTHAFDAQKSDIELHRWRRKCEALAAENGNLKMRIEDLRQQLRKRGKPDDGNNVISFPTPSKSD